MIMYMYGCVILLNVFTKPGDVSYLQKIIVQSTVVLLCMLIDRKHLINSVRSYIEYEFCLRHDL